MPLLIALLPCVPSNSVYFEVYVYRSLSIVVLFAYFRVSAFFLISCLFYSSWPTILSGTFLGFVPVLSFFLFRSFQFCSLCPLYILLPSIAVVSVVVAYDRGVCISQEERTSRTIFGRTVVDGQ